MQDQQFLEDIVKAIVNNPNDVKVLRTIDERGVLLTLDVNPQDMATLSVAAVKPLVLSALCLKS